MNKPRNLSESVLSLHYTLSEIRDNLMRTMKIGPDHELTIDYSNRINDLAQIGCVPEEMIEEDPELAEEVRSRLIASMTGIKHNKRFDK